MRNSSIVTGLLEHRDAISCALNLSSNRVRQIDLEEFKDIIPFAEILDDPSFGALFGGALGLLSLDCTAVISREVWGTQQFHRPIFMGISSGNGTTKTLTGFAWKGEEDLTKKERFQVTRDVVQLLIIESTATDFICHVRNDNVETLKGWRMIQRLFPQLTVMFQPDVQPNYTLVSIHKGTN